MSEIAEQSDVIIVGAGAAGLMAARTLSKAGKTVIVLEAQDRIGGRIKPASKEAFGYAAQAGAEFLHGEAALTRSLAKEAGLSVTDQDGDIWTLRGGSLMKNDTFVIPYQDEVEECLKSLTKDIPIAEFLDTYFSDERYAVLRNVVSRMVQGYEAADPNNMSAFSLRNSWLDEGGFWKAGWVDEGYQKIPEYLAQDAKVRGARILLSSEVASISRSGEGVVATTKNGKSLAASKIVITCALPVISKISFSPEIPEKLAAAEKIGFGKAIKGIFRFKTKWWANARGVDMSRLTYFLSNELFLTWWTQYPHEYPVLTGWLGGPEVEPLADASPEQLLDAALTSLANIFEVERAFLESELVEHVITNWRADPYVCGAYSYSTPESGEAIAELSRSVDGQIYFAGEALSHTANATVEGALLSGKEVAEQILR